MDVRIEYWQNHPIRFVCIDDEWYAALKDVCDAVGIGNSSDVRARAPFETLRKDRIDTIEANSYHNTELCTLITEEGIYEAFATSRKLECQQFRRWMFSMVKDMRAQMGFEAYEAFKMLDSEPVKKQKVTIIEEKPKRPSILSFRKRA